MPAAATASSQRAPPPAEPRADRIATLAPFQGQRISPSGEQIADPTVPTGFPSGRKWADEVPSGRKWANEVPSGRTCANGGLRREEGANVDPRGEWPS